MSEDPKQEYFSDGMTEDITSDLSKISSLFVIARNSAFTYKGKAVKVQEVGRELGVRYVLEGSVRKADNQVRVTAQLIDATTGGHLWSERYDRPLKDIFALQDEITHRLVASLRVEVQEVELERVRRTPTENLTAYDYVLRGAEYYERFTKETNVQARQMFERAIVLDPAYAEAYARLAWTYYLEWGALWSQDSQILEQAFIQAQKAVALNDSLPQAHQVLGALYLWKKQHDQAIAEVKRAIALDPNEADSYGGWARILNYAGQPQEAIELAEKAMRLNPRYRTRYPYYLGLSYYLLKRYEEAISALKEALARNPSLQPARLVLAATYTELGQEEEAQAEVNTVLGKNPTLSLDGLKQRVPLKDPAVLDRYLAALRRAGLK